MVLIGIGCSPVLMASYYIFARVYSTRVFATLAGAVIGAGSLGNIAGSAPLAALAGAFGWRPSLGGLAFATLATAAILWVFVKDPPRALTHEATKGSLRDLLRIPALWAILPLMAVAYAPAAALRGLWAGPYLRDVFRADTEAIGRATLVMSLALVAGSFANGPLDRVFGTRKWVVFTGSAVTALGLGLLAAFPESGTVAAVTLLSLVGFFGAGFPAIMAHSRAFFPAHLVGRGVSLMNMFGIGGAGLLQFLSGRYVRAVSDSADPTAAYSALFLFFLVPLAIGLSGYLFSTDRTG
jgi:predicted MFS family arabinose efflux permease